MEIHITQGEPGCAFGRDKGHVVIVVDALRASATAAMLLDAGATGLYVVREVDEALALKNKMPDALLYGERFGLPPEGFDFGNSPRTVAAANGKTVIFTTTTGAQRLVAAWGAPAVFLGTTLNAAAVAAAAARAAIAAGAGIVIVPAGLAGNPDFSAQEDWVAAAVIAEKIGGLPICGGNACAYWADRIRSEGVRALFFASPHAAKLLKIGLGDDIEYCAQIDMTSAVPQAVEVIEYDFGTTRARAVVCRRSGFVD